MNTDLKGSGKKMNSDKKNFGGNWGNMNGLDIRFMKKLLIFEFEILLWLCKRMSSFLGNISLRK